MQPSDANARVSYARVLCAVGTSRVIHALVVTLFLLWTQCFALKLLQLLVFCSPYQVFKRIITMLFIATLILKRRHPRPFLGMRN